MHWMDLKAEHVLPRNQSKFSFAATSNDLWARDLLVTQIYAVVLDKCATECSSIVTSFY